MAAVAISIDGDGDTPKLNTFTLKLEDFIHEHEDPNEDTTTTHHVLKFHPKDHNPQNGLWADGTNEWLFKRMPRPQRSEQEKKMREKKIRKGEIDPKEDDVDKDAWKRPWLVTYDEDTDFSHVFEARREGDKRSKSHKLCKVTLAKVQMKALKGDGAAEPQRIQELERLLFGPNKEMERIFLRCMDIVLGPGTDCYSKKVTTKRRLRVDDTYQVHECISLLSDEGLKELQQLQDQERQITKRFREQIKSLQVDVNGDTCVWKPVLRDSEEGNKGYSYFWMEKAADQENQTYVVRPVCGDWWNVRKDASKRGREAEVGEGEGEGSLKVRIKKEKEVVKPNKFDALRDKFLFSSQQEGDRKKGMIKMKQEGYGNEDDLRQKWHEEQHESGDEMDHQQCGDIDDDDYDQEQAKKGDDPSINADRLERELMGEEETKQDMESDSDDDENEALDDDGKKMDRLLRGKPSKEDDKEEDEKEEEEPNAETAVQVDSQKPEKKKKKEALPKIRINTAALQTSSTLGKRPADNMSGGASISGAQQPAKRVDMKVEGGPKVPAQSGGSLEDKVRKAVSADKMMTVKKLLRVMQVNTMTADCKNEFMALVKRICLVTKDTVSEGPYQDQKIIKIKP